MRVLTLSALTALGLTACATDTGPVCRAPTSYEMATFRAIVSHDSQALANQTLPGTARNSVIAQSANVQSHIWGSQGYTHGTVVGLLSQPPLCVMDDPAFPASDAVRQVIVYPQRSFDRVAPGPDADPVLFPYGTRGRDYMSCRFEQTAAGWKLADLCGLPQYASTVTG